MDKMNRMGACFPKGMRKAESAYPEMDKRAMDGMMGNINVAEVYVEKKPDGFYKENRKEKERVGRGADGYMMKEKFEEREVY